MKTLIIIGLILTLLVQIWLVIELCTYQRNQGYRECKTELKTKLENSSINFEIK